MIKDFWPSFNFSRAVRFYKNFMILFGRGRPERNSQKANYWGGEGDNAGGF